MFIFQLENPRNIKQGKRALGAYELGQKRNLSAIEAIEYNDHLCLEINDLWHTLHSTFNLAQNHYVNINILEEFPDKALEEWPPFSRKEFMKATTKCNNSSAPGPDKML